MLPEGYANEMAAEKLKAEMNATDLHPMACSGPEAWDAWCVDVCANTAEWMDAKRKMGLEYTGYNDLTEADRSAFCFSVEDRIKWTANGMTVKKKGKRK